MSVAAPRVVVLLVERSGAPAPRQLDAWQEAVAAYAGEAELAHVWAGDGPVPAGSWYPTPGAAASVLELSGDTVAVVAEASAVPGPHLVQRLVDEVRDATGRVVDARLLPVELTLVDDRERGYHLEEGAHASDAVLAESRAIGDEEDDRDDDEGSDDGADVEVAAEEAVSGHDLHAQDGWLLHARVSGACCATHVQHLFALDEALVAPPSESAGRDLVAAAAAHGIDVVVAGTAAVSLPVHVGWDGRMDGWVAAPAERAVEWTPRTHPAELPGSLLSVVAGQFHLRPVTGDQGGEQDGPFLTIVTRTQGRRLHCLEDLLTCLAGQSDGDFEVLLMCHRTTAEETAAVREVVGSASSWVRDKARLIEVERPGRAAPLNDGFAAARGRYIVALDDDDTVLAHYVSTYKAAAVENDGRVLRTVAVRQDVAPVGADDLRAVSVGDPFRPFPMDFNLIDHLVTNYSPIMTIAFPQGGFHDLGLRFDESLDTTEDWDLVVRTAAVLGVASVREVTSVYRWWVHTGASSRELHTKEEWAAARTRVQQAFEKTVLLLSPEETRRMIASLERARADSDKANRKARELATSQHEVILRMEEVRIAHDRAVEDVQLLSDRAQAARDRVQEVREKMRKRHANHLGMLREADTLLADRPDLRPSGSIVDLPPEELRSLVKRLRTEPPKRSWGRPSSR